MTGMRRSRRAGGCKLAGAAAETAVTSQSQRFLLCPRPNERATVARQAVPQETELGGRHREGRASDSQDSQGTAEGETYVCPGFQGGTNWFSTSFNPGTGLYYFQALERCNLFSKRTMEWQAGKGYMGGAARPAPGETFEKVLRAINIQTGEITWELPQVSGALTASAGMLSTASGLVFFGENSGAFMAADAVTGKPSMAVPDKPDVEGFADDLHVRQQTVHGGRRRASASSRLRCLTNAVARAALPPLSFESETDACTR